MSTEYCVIRSLALAMVFAVVDAISVVASSGDEIKHLFFK